MQYINNLLTTNLVESVSLESSVSEVLNFNVSQDFTHPLQVFHRAILVHQDIIVVSARAQLLQSLVLLVTTAMRELRFQHLVQMALTHKVTKMVSRILVNVLVVQLAFTV